MLTPFRQRVGSTGLPRALWLSLCFGLLPALLPGAEAGRVHFALPAAAAEVSLETFAEQAAAQVVYLLDDVRGVVTHPVAGTFAPGEALARMLAGTALKAEREGSTGAFVIKREPAGSQRPGDLPSTNSPPRSTPHAGHTAPPMKNSPLAILGGWIAFVLAPASPAETAERRLSDANAGSIGGYVSNAATGNHLEGARVSVPALGLAELSDQTGRYVLRGVPAGQHDMVVSYLGLETQRVPVALGPGGQVTRDFELTAEIYRLDAFKVVGEREGEAAALTLQRNAGNVKNVIAMDSFGNLPNLSAGEVIARLPGIAGDPTEEGLLSQFSVRGMPSALNTVTVDGQLLASIGMNRNFQLQSITATIFEQLELIKGHRPDQGADSLGGTVNMKRRSPLSMREQRRTSFNATVRMAPAFTEQIPLREQHRAHPLLNLGYQEVFSLFGGQRNLGVAANFFYSENGVGAYRVTNQYQNTDTAPAFVWSYKTREIFNNRKQMSADVKTDFRYSPRAKFMLDLMVNNNLERFKRAFDTQASTGNAATVPNTTTSGVMPGFTDKITQVRPVTASRVDVVMNGPNSFSVDTYLLGFGAEHELGRLHLDYYGGLSRNRQELGLLPQGGQQSLTTRLTNVGWILDRTHSDAFPRFIQTAGPDIGEAANYRPIANGLEKQTETSLQKIPQLRVNARYDLPAALRTSLKVGAAWREQAVERRDFSRRWSYLGSGPLAADPAALSFASVKTGMKVPWWQLSDYMKVDEPADPALWREDRYYHEQLRFTGTNSAREAVSAGYLMIQGHPGGGGWLGRTGYLAGVRVENTKTRGTGWTRARFSSSAAQQLADPAGSAARDYAENQRTTSGRYTHALPSVHLSRELVPNLKAHLAWSTSFGRPALVNLVPNETANESAQTLTVNNPGLRPQTARNWDATLSYYFEPVGNLSVGWFHKTIRDYIVTGIDQGLVLGGGGNGFGGAYEGFTLLSSENAGTAYAQGWEFSYQQQFSFLPGLLRGFGVQANYSLLRTHGDFGGAAYRKTNQVAGFIPEAGNASLSWRHRRFSARVLYNFTGGHLTTYNALNPALSLYRRDRRSVNLGLTYQWRPAVNLTCDISNLTKEPQQFYQGFPDRLQDYIANFVTITLGVNGRF